MSNAFTVFYSIEGEKGEDANHPNAVRVTSNNKVLRMKDFIEAFPLNISQYKVRNCVGPLDS